MNAALVDAAVLRRKWQHVSNIHKVKKRGPG